MPRPSSFAILSPLLSLAICACGGAPSSPVTAAAASTSSSSAATATAAAAPARRIPAPDMLRYWPFNAPPTALLYADIGGFLRTELGSGAIPAVLVLAQGNIDDALSQCLQTSGSSVKDLLFGADASGAGLVIVRIDDSQFDLTRCLGAIGAQPVKLAGAQRAFALSELLIVQLPGFVLVGSEASTRRALSASPGSGAFPPELALGANEYVAWSAELDQKALRGTLLASRERFRLSVDANLAEADAKELEQVFLAAQQRGLQLPGLKGPEGAMVAKLLASVTLTRTGSHLAGSLDLHEPPVDQARDIGMMAALASYGVRKYILNAKSAEARSTLREIAKSYEKWWQAPQGKPKPASKLISFPPAPAVVPKGLKYQSVPSDWKAWQTIGFKLDDPQYYQYEIRAAKDGHSADLIARGDLDADGKQSEFRLRATLGKTLQFAPTIEEQDPEE